jgi:hypothetical protein
MARRKIPEPIPIDWRMREVASAMISVCELDDGRQQRVIEHAPLASVKPEMMLWFLENIDRTDLPHFLQELYTAHSATVPA